MSTPSPRRTLEAIYFQEAQAYLRRLPLEHFMETTSQATQRKIFVESLDLVQAERPEVQTFSELLVQYPELELELGLLERWVRFWFRGQLLPLLADLLRELNQTRAQLQQAEQRARLAAEQQAEAEQRARLATEQQLAQLQARLAQLEQAPEKQL